MRTSMVPLLAILMTASAWAQSGPATGWEDGQPPGNANQVLYAKDVAGPFNTMNPGPECSRRTGEQSHGGNSPLMSSGTSNSAYAYCYYKLFDDNVPIRAGTRVQYWIWHQG